MPKTFQSKDLRRWLHGKPHQMAIVVAARAALRAAPMLSSAIRPHGELGDAGDEIILPTFRGLAVSWLGAQFSTLSTEFINASYDASNAASGADAIAKDFSLTAAFAARAASFAARATEQPKLAARYAVSSAEIAARADSAEIHTAANSPDANSASEAAVRVADNSATSLSFWAAVSADTEELDGTRMQSLGASSLAIQVLWPTGAPRWVGDRWTHLKRRLLAEHSDWRVWTDWYDDRLSGGPVNRALELSRVMIAKESWDQGPRAVNAEIIRLIEDGPSETRGEDTPNAAVLESLPAQGLGPRYRANDEGLIDRAPREEIDESGNDLKTIENLKPLALRCAAQLQASLSPNQFPELLAAVEQYRAALEPGPGKVVEWGEVWGLGVMLANAASSASRKIEDRMLPSLEDQEKTALDSLLTLHGPMILASGDGARFSAMAAEFSMTRDQQNRLRDVVEHIADQIKNSPDIATPRAAESLSAAAETIGKGAHPERGAVYGLATIRNISVVIIAGAALAAPAAIGSLLGAPIAGALVGAPLSFVVVEAVKKSAAFSSLVSQLGAKLDSMSNDELSRWLSGRGRRYAPFRKFVLINKDALLAIAGTTPELRWIAKYIEFIEIESRESPTPPKFD